MEIKYRAHLIQLLRHYNLPRQAAEVGVAEGLFSRDLLESGIEKLYCIDSYRCLPNVRGDGANPQEWHNQNYRHALSLLRPWGGQVEWLRGLSRDMCNLIPGESLGLVYLDGDHSYAGVTEDLELYYDCLACGGIMAGHDYLNFSYGVNQAVQEFCHRNKIEVHTILENKEEDAGFWFQKKC